MKQENELCGRMKFRKKNRNHYNSSLNNYLTDMDLVFFNQSEGTVLLLFFSS